MTSANLILGRTTGCAKRLSTSARLYGARRPTTPPSARPSHAAPYLFHIVLFQNVFKSQNVNRVGRKLPHWMGRSATGQVRSVLTTASRGAACKSTKTLPPGDPSTGNGEGGPNGDHAAKVAASGPSTGSETATTPHRMHIF